MKTATHPATGGATAPARAHTAAAEPAPRRQARVSPAPNGPATAPPGRNIFKDFPFLDLGYVTQEKINRRLYGE
jgi:hypothetical protein